MKTTKKYVHNFTYQVRDAAKITLMLQSSYELKEKESILFWRLQDACYQAGVTSFTTKDFKAFKKSLKK